MSVTELSPLNSNLDLYPSRKGQPAKIIPRQDPCVYSDDAVRPPISREDIQFYQQNGFLIIKNVFPPEEITDFKNELNHLCSLSTRTADNRFILEKDQQDVRSIFEVHILSKRFEELSEDPRLIELARYLLNDDIYIHQSRVNYKPGFNGNGFNWHSDFETWHTEDGMPRMRALSMSIPLTENTSTNGPLMFVPRSHHHYLSCTEQTPAHHYIDSLKEQQIGIPNPANISGLVSQYGMVQALSQPGSLILFDSNTLHGSNSNISPHPRSNVFFVYNALSNKVVAPFDEAPPRPEFLAARRSIRPIP
ncbi:phytanoyl-CoA dioxygenase family protein [Litoribrevibacter albus]|uniref:Ectoine hydroxylase n=1 Tax=Litoribrevibacter albus TaxID=1473156 RepID=A0AA37SBI9_9GAMM|nr:phytanoyl-CoA dioxygenase family protein [Litoribrevibacter albus]GLQ32985.1 ectoine hydroxylase [Litoribrevibacter albus]